MNKVLLGGTVVAVIVILATAPLAHHRRPGEEFSYDLRGGTALLLHSEAEASNRPHRQQKENAAVNWAILARLDDPTKQEAVLKVTVEEFPNTPIIDATKPWPRIPAASVRVRELGISLVTDSTGSLILRAPVGPSGDAVYTFEVTVPWSKFKSVTRYRVYQGGSNFALFFHTTSDTYVDTTDENPELRSVIPDPNE